jgi:hypothetical protein
MDLPNDSPPAYEAPYTNRNAAPEKSHTSLPVVDLKPNYPFRGFRWWVVGTAAKLLAWEPVIHPPYLVNFGTRQLT